VDVVVPFAGDEAAAAETLEAIAVLAPRATSVTLVDNSREGSAAALEAQAGVDVLRAAEIQGSYYARNAGAGATRAPWLLFVDSDCLPPADLIERYLAPEPAPATGIVAGGVRSAEGASFAARYAADRGHIDEGFHIAHGPHPAGVTANLLVRRAAFEDVGGFEQGVRSGADVDFCWRVQEAGWVLEHRPSATLRHRHPDDVPRLLAKARRHAAGRAWVNDRWPGALPRPPIARPLLRAPLVALWWALRGNRERARFKLVDMRLSAASLLGYYRGDNRAAPGALSPAGAPPDGASGPDPSP
jgi:GT2 family glycosyltransferase